MTNYVVRKGDSLQSVLNKTARGDDVVIMDGYRPKTDSWPVRIDTEVRISSSPHNRIEVPDSSGAGLLLDLDGPNRPPGVTLVNVYIDAKGTKSAFRIQNARYCTLVGCIAEHASDYGFLVNSDDAAPNSNRFFHCDAHINDGHGFYIDELAHSTFMVGCRAIANGGRGLWSGNNYASSWVGGGLERNGNQGVYIDGSEVFTIQNAYIEGNAEDSSDEILVDRSQTTTIANTYLNGLDNSETNGIRFRNSRNCSVRNIEYRNLNGLVVNDGSTDTDLHRSSHYALDDSPFLVEDSGTKTRDRGVIAPTNLSKVNGQYKGDRGIHNGSNGPFGLAVWNGSAWVSMRNGKTIG